MLTHDLSEIIINASNFCIQVAHNYEQVMLWDLYNCLLELFIPVIFVFIRSIVCRAVALKNCKFAEL